MDPYLDQFLSPQEGASRAAVKRLTATIEQQLIEATVNAPDWHVHTLSSFSYPLTVSWTLTGTPCMPREWQGTFSGATRRPSASTNSSLSRRRKLSPFYSRRVPPFIRDCRLVDLFCTPDLVPNLTAIRRHLLTYYSLLQSTHLTNAVLSSLPLPETLDPQRPIPLPSRLFTLSLLIRDTLALLLGLPFFIGPLLIHVPAYAFARVGARLAHDEEETQAQNKVVFGLLLLLLIYPATFFFFWAFLRYTPLGALASLALVVLIHSYHTKLINGECLMTYAARCPMLNPLQTIMNG